jgi:peptidoglycan-associated lipoprotein
MRFFFQMLTLLVITACSPLAPVVYSPTVEGAPQSGQQTPSSSNSEGTSEYFRNIVGAPIYFDVDKHDLTAQARAQLDLQADWLRQHQDFAAVIEGHADEQGTREYNFALSARRANEAKEYLVSQGVRSARLQIIPYGKERPAEVCSQEVCYARNRRAVTQVRYATGL